MENTVRTAEVAQLDPRAALELAAEEAARLTGAEGAAIAIGNASSMYCCASAGDAPAVGVMLGPDSGLSGLCLRTSELVQCDDTASDPRVDPQSRGRMSVRSVLVLPVVVDERLQAILEVFSSKPRAFHAQHRDELSRKAQEIAAVLSDANARQQPESSTKERQASSITAERNVQAAPPAGTVSHAGEGIAGVPSKAVSAEAGVRSTRGIPLPAALKSLSTRTKAVLAVAFLAVLAIAWYLLPSPRPAGTAAAPATKASTAAPSTPQGGESAAPEISVEQSSLSVAGLEQGPKVAGSASQLTPGKLMLKVNPAYPASARAISGSVVLTALVTKEGKVTNVRFVRGPEALASPAMEAVQKWVYEPYRLGGVPVAVETMIVIRFTPHKQP